jgi:hypothetical protein
VLSESSTVLLGQGYLPFGRYNTNLTNDTLILEAAEIRESIIGYQYGIHGFKAEAFLFNGDADRGSDTLKNYVIHLQAKKENVSAHLDLLSNIFEADAFGDDAERLNAKAEAAVIAGGQIQLGALSLIGEYLTVFTDNDPKALQLEAAYEFAQFTLAFSYQSTSDFGDLLPKNRISIGGSTSVSEFALFSVEIWRDEHQAPANGGAAENDLGLVVQLAVEF